MFRTAVVCTDGTAASDQVMSIAARLRQFGVQRVTLVCPLADGEPERGPAERLMAQERALSSRGFEVHAVVRRGAATRVVSDVAAESGAEVVLVGVSGLGLSAKVLVGGADHDTGARLGRPMLSVRVSALGNQTSVRALSAVPLLSKVLFASDFSESSEAALEVVERMVRSGLRDLVLLHVGPEAEPSAQMRIRVRLAAERLRAAGPVRIAEEFAHGDAAETITHRAHRPDITLTVMGSRGHGLFSGIAVGSVGARVARYIETPLLVVPPASAELSADALSA